MSKRRRLPGWSAILIAFILILGIGLDIGLLRKLGLDSELQRELLNLFSAHSQKKKPKAPQTEPVEQDFRPLELEPLETLQKSLAADQARLIQREGGRLVLADPADADVWVGTSTRTVERKGMKLDITPILIFAYLRPNIPFEKAREFLDKSELRGTLVIGEWDANGDGTTYYSFTCYRFEEKPFPLVGANTVGVIGSSQSYGPLIAAAALFPGRTDKQRFLVTPNWKGGEISYTYSIEERVLRLAGDQRTAGSTFSSLNLTGEYKRSR